jgi:hypothetical protein
MKPSKLALLAFFVAAAAALASSLVLSEVTVAYSGVLGCEQGCQFVAGGWPFPYIVDHPGISPSNSVSLVEAALGVDIFWSGHFLATLLSWLAPFATVAAIVWRRTLPRAA